ncbi:MAG: VOC family protein [Legionellaceae bacterium]|nr:VOC family protein [Legionellaceae bacterium]
MLDKRLVTALTPELCCSNIKTSLIFYIQTLGFTIQYQREVEGFAMLERQGSRIMLDEIKNNATGTNRTWITAPLEKPFGRGINLEIRTTHVDALYARVQQAGVPIFLPIEEKWYRVDAFEVGNRQFIILDPDGYMLRFAEYLGERKKEV